MSPMDPTLVMTASVKKTALESRPLERVHYFPRQLITAEDMVAEQQYFQQKLRRHNRFLHGWGVVCGLAVRAAPADNEPWRVSISSGYALSPQGDEIYVPEVVCIDLAKCGLETSADLCEPGRTTTRIPRERKLFVAIRYVECPSRPVRIHPAGCGCDGGACEHSRIRDDYQIGCLSELPETHRPVEANVCAMVNGRWLPQCLPCPEDPWVVLAEVAWPDNQTTAITNDHIDNFVRQPLLSTAVLQQQLIDCCCDSRPEPTRPPRPVPVRVVAVNPANGQIFTNTAPDNVILTFDKPLDPPSVNTSTIVVRTAEGRIIPGAVQYNALSRTATFTPNASFLQFSTGVQTQFLVIARGGGDNTIRDQDGLMLDGDDNGAEGGNFQSAFTLQIIIG